jgi:phenylalanyl-tRNA synthetase beta chain
MKISYNWLQTYFKKPLPSPEKLEELFTFHAFEVEGMEKRPNGDTILDVKVLPDRAHYALSHQGVALEASLMTGLDRLVPELSAPTESGRQAEAIKASVTTPLCRRFMGQKIEDITVSESPTWLKERLESVGQRSINMIVDVTNFVMLDVGQPLHAFDADKTVGDIVVRAAKPGEKVVILNGAEITLDGTMTVIADAQGPLDVAGIKGGKRAEVTADTKNIILVANNFDPISIRRTSAKIGIRNEASKRFENNLSPEWASVGLARATALIFELAPGAAFGPAIDIYNPKPKQIHLEIAPSEISAILGVAVPEKEMIAILEKMEIEVEAKKALLGLTIPLYRQGNRPDLWL